MTRKSIQIAACRADEHGIERCDIEEAEFFSLYIGAPGAYKWLADFVTIEEARKQAATMARERHLCVVDYTTTD